MSKRRHTSDHTPPLIEEKHAPMGERVGDRPLPPGVHRREKRVDPEVRRRRDDPDGAAFERQRKARTTEIAGSASDTEKRVSGMATTDSHSTPSPPAVLSEKQSEQAAAAIAGPAFEQPRVATPHRWSHVLDWLSLVVSKTRLVALAIIVAHVAVAVYAFSLLS